jgi:hypothetical protein
MKSERSHARAADKSQRSIAIRTALLDDIKTLADEDGRTVNNMIEKLLTESVKLYDLGKIKKTRYTPSGKPDKRPVYKENQKTKKKKP